jgi:ABC-type proline/glycine betaine transport system ATPase subunit
MDGWIKLERSLLNHWIFQDPVKFRIWIGLLLIVNHSDQKVNIGQNIYDCKRGQSVRSLLSWANTFKVSKDYIRNFFKLLAKDGMITIENIQISTRITICNYDTYQDTSNAKQTTSKRKPNANQTQSHTNKNDKNDKNEKNEIKIYKSFLHLSISIDEVQKLYLLGYTQKQIDEVLEAIENYKKNTSYVSLYYTAKKWLQKEQAEKSKTTERPMVH